MKKYIRLLERASIKRKLPKMNMERCLKSAVFLALFIPVILMVNIIVLNQTLIRPEYNKYLCAIIIYSILFIGGSLLAKKSKNAKSLYKYLYRTYFIAIGSCMMLLSATYFETVGSLFYFFLFMVFFAVVPFFGKNELIVSEIIAGTFMIYFVVVNIDIKMAVAQIILFNIVRITITAWKYMVTINNMKLQNKLNEEKQVSEKDLLTGLLNRRGLTRKTNIIWPLCKKHKIICGGIMIDIDNFKKYNDTYGHIQGDACIQKVAGIIHSQTRGRADMLVRMGGEEFFVFVKDTDKTEMTLIARKIRQALKDEAIPHRTNSTRGLVTVSSGVAIIKAETEDGCQRLYKMADKELYNAKVSGKDSISYKQKIITRAVLIEGQMKLS